MATAGMLAATRSPLSSQRGPSCRRLTGSPGFWQRSGVEAVYEVVGGMIANFIDALHRDDQVRIVACHHEQAAGFAAEGHARMNGIPGVAMGTSGPGAINLLTALGSCHFDSTPAVFITGQVNRSEQKRDRPIRQLGFQETDVVAMAAPIAKAAMRVDTIEELPRQLTEAFALACAGRPGPVLVDIPLDLQRLEVDAPLPELPAAAAAAGREQPIDEAAIARILDDLQRAERPLILAGGGLRAGQAVDSFREAVDRMGVPVVNSLMGVDALPFEHPLRVGLIGTYGNRWANIALLALRCAAGSRQPLGHSPDRRRHGGVRCRTHDPSRRLRPRRGQQPRHGCHALIAQLSTATVALDVPPASTRVGRTRMAPGDRRAGAEVAGHRRARRNRGDQSQLAHAPALGSAVRRAYVADVGQHQMWAAQSLELTPTSGS